MPTTFYVIDDEFAASSGSNVNAEPDRSIFDNPPNSTKNLEITSNTGDGAPNLFEVGESYDLTWQGHGGGNMDDAVIIRSDYLGPGEGAVVFEGINSNTGELYQVVWTPNHDLEQWFYDNGGASNPPGFWTDEQDPDTYRVVCFAADTLITTPNGPRRVQDLRPGDKVITLDNGPQEICWIGVKPMLGAGSAAPVLFQPGILNNDRPLYLSQQHRVLLSGLQADIFFGQSEVWVPAKSLTNGTSITIARQSLVTYYHLLLPKHEVLLAENQPTESLYLGDVARNALGPRVQHEVAQYFPDLQTNPQAAAMQSARMILKLPEAQTLAQSMGIATPAPKPATPTYMPFVA